VKNDEKATACRKLLAEIGKPARVYLEAVKNDMDGHHSVE
jgi:hypothetical protein